MSDVGKQIIEVPQIPVGPNGPDGLLRMHWTQRSKYWNEWVMLVRAGIAFSPEVKPLVMCLVHIHQVRKQIFRDDDNLAASCKPILDALETLNLIQEDSHFWIMFEPSQETGPEPKTIITIEPITHKDPILYDNERIGYGTCIGCGKKIVFYKMRKNGRILPFTNLTWVPHWTECNSAFKNKYDPGIPDRPGKGYNRGPNYKVGSSRSRGGMPWRRR